LALFSSYLERELRYLALFSGLKNIKLLILSNILALFRPKNFPLDSPLSFAKSFVFIYLRVVLPSFQPGSATDCCQATIGEIMS